MDSTNRSGDSELVTNASNVIAIAAHEFKTPLATITSVVDLLSLKLQKDQHMNAFYEKQLSRITSEIFSLNSMVDEMLTVNNILSGNITSHKEMTDLADLLLPLKEQYRNLPDESRELLLTITGTPRKLCISSVQVERILSNLISNAFKYSRKASPAVHLDYQDNAALITITDDGIGIPAEDLPHLFQPYFRGSNTNGIPGTGLGLSIVKTFAKANDGEISVSSHPDKGTVFTLAFRYPDTCQ